MEHTGTIRLRTILFLYGVFISSWIIAWIIFKHLENKPAVNSLNNYDFYYWFLMKLLLWVAPSIFLGRRLKNYSSIEIFETKHLKESLLWGILIGLILFSINVAGKYFAGKMPLNPAITSVWINAVIISPVVEEILFRGIILNALKTKLPFYAANILTSILFVGIHLPGWYFQNKLLANLLGFQGGAVSIFLLGLIFGAIAYKTKNISGSIAAHCLNNLSGL